MKNNFNAIYIKTRELATLSDGRKVELGHYKDSDNGKEYADKIYITGSYISKKDNKEKTFINATGLTLKELEELQKIKL